MFATTATRSQGSPALHRQVEEDTKERLERLAGDPLAIEARIRELDEEWDVERAIQANAATLALSGTILAMLQDRRWSFLPLVVMSFLLQHATQGWCPPLPILRRMGFRTQVEIERERYALKALRGDFANMPADGATPRQKALAAVEALR
ncbi:MAG TPA: hypothetical protein VGO17_08760 [Aurantimonas sp.]|jgi:hypothetical protein|nr:hypothetical protein [Aurantimonas sp.]